MTFSGPKRLRDCAMCLASSSATTPAAPQPATANQLSAILNSLQGMGPTAKVFAACGLSRWHLPQPPRRRPLGSHSSPCTKTVPNRPLTHRAPALTGLSLGLVTRTILLSCVVNSRVQPTPQNGQMVRVVA